MICLSPGRRATVAALAVLMLTVSACGAKEEDSTPDQGNGSPLPSVAVDQALADRVPDSFASDGTLTVGVETSYAPAEFLDADGETAIGFDIDLFNAVAATLGLTVDWQAAQFADIIPGVQSGKYEIGVSAFTISAEREEQVLMISYFNAGTQWVAAKGSTLDPNDVCGKKVAVQTGTVQVDDITARDQACADAGQASITIDQYSSQSDASAAVISGKDDAMLADSPISAYAVKQTNDQLTLIGEVYDSAPYGYVLAQDQQEMAEVLRDAVASLIDSGCYEQILATWGVTNGAITTDPAVNP